MAYQRFITDHEFQLRMRPAADRVYQQLFADCVVERVSEQIGKPDPLDVELGIDAKIHFPQGQWVSAQEKFRRHKWLSALDFTQEYYNAVGTEFEAPGEWFHLAAHVYFYGWANATEEDFAAWVLLDVLKYKLLVKKSAGLCKLGKIHQNDAGGSANFFAIPIENLRPAVLKAYGAAADKLHESAVS